MCRASTHPGGGYHCKESPAARNQRNVRRRTRHAFQTSKEILDKVLAEPNGKRWLGEVKLNLSHPLVAKAFAIAVRAHKGTNRINGEAYINHPLRVAERLQNNGFNEEVIMVALLHDAVEDSDLTLGDLRRLGFNERVVSGVDSVTKRGGEAYPDAVARASQHPIGRLVKLSDNLDNSSAAQINPLSPERQAKAIGKYTPARVYILKSLADAPAETLFDPSQGFHGEYKIRLHHVENEFFV